MDDNEIWDDLDLPNEADLDDRGLRWVGYCEYLVGVAHETATPDDFLVFLLYEHVHQNGGPTWLVNAGKSNTAGTNATTAPSAQYGRPARQNRLRPRRREKPQNNTE